MTIAEALAQFDREWVAGQPLTPRVAYRRTLQLIAFWLDRAGRSTGDDLETLSDADLEAFVRWHGVNALGEGSGSGKAALHVARLGAHLATAQGRPDLDAGRARLRACARCC